MGSRFVEKPNGQEKNKKSDKNLAKLRDIASKLRDNCRPHLLEQFAQRFEQYQDKKSLKMSKMSQMSKNGRKSRLHRPFSTQCPKLSKKRIEKHRLNREMHEKIASFIPSKIREKIDLKTQFRAMFKRKHRNKFWTKTIEAMNFNLNKIELNKEKNIVPKLKKLSQKIILDNFYKKINQEKSHEYFYKYLKKYPKLFFPSAFDTPSYPTNPMFLRHPPSRSLDKPDFAPGYGLMLPLVPLMGSQGSSKKIKKTGKKTNNLILPRSNTHSQFDLDDIDMDFYDDDDDDITQDNYPNEENGGNIWNFKNEQSNNEIQKTISIQTKSPQKLPPKSFTMNKNDNVFQIVQKNFHLFYGPTLDIYTTSENDDDDDDDDYVPINPHAFDPKPKSKQNKRKKRSKNDKNDKDWKPKKSSKKGHTRKKTVVVYQFKPNEPSLPLIDLKQLDMRQYFKVKNQIDHLDEID
jgi:hypothetical protein